MPDLGLVGLVLLLLVLVGVMAPRAFAAEPPPKQAAAQAEPAKPAQLGAPVLTAKELEERLSRLARSEPAIKEVPVAMCYKVAAPPQTVDYVCPIDGSRTQYARDSAAYPMVRDLPSLRQRVKELPGLNASLDESAMCRRCAPQGTGGVALVVRHPDGRTVRTDSVTSGDLLLLGEFLSGKEVHAGSRGAQTALKDQMPRIRQLLGLLEK